MLKELIIVGLACIIFTSGILLGVTLEDGTPLELPSFIGGTLEGASFEGPRDRIKERDIRVFEKNVMIRVDNAVIARFTPTGSMEPVLDEYANAIEIVPKSMSDIHVGDIISYQSKFADQPIIHRVTQKGIDEEGPFVRTKGDKLTYVDPERIRFEQIERVVVGILY